MRTLKKTLALVLVVVMVVSFGAIGASADFKDVTTSTDYYAAIQVLSGLGVIDGVTDETFKPDGTLTREQAAKIITYIKLGPDYAELISESASSSFDDVGATRWSASYIEYCANLKIVEGVAAKTFNPQGTLTTAAFTKMLLVAIGNDADKNGLNGSSWAINTATLAMELGVTDSNIAISNKTAITRAEACQLALQALFVGKKTITSTSTQYVLTVTANNEALLKLSGNTYKTFDAAKSAAVAAYDKAVYGQDYTVASMDIISETEEGSLADTVFDLSKTSSGEDAFKRPGVAYIVDGETLFRSASTPVLSYTTAKAGKAIYADLGLTKVPTVAHYVDGVATGGDIDASSTDTFGGNGTLTQVYKTGTNAYTVVEMNYYFDTVKSVKTSKDGATGVSTTTLTLAGGATSTKLVNFAKKDAVIYTKVGNTIMSIEKANVISGTLTKAVNDKNFTIGDTVYQLGAKKVDALTAASIVGAGNANMGKTVSFYVDGNGYLMAAVDATTAATAGTYIKVLAAETPGNNSSWMNPGNDYVGKVYGILSDGSYGEYTVNYGKSSTAAVKNAIYEYNTNTSGQLVLDTATNQSEYVVETTSSITSGQTVAEGKVLNSNTMFIFYTQNTNDASIKSLTAKKGNTNSGSIAEAQVVFEKGVALAVFVGGDFNSGTEAADLAYVDASSKQTTTEVSIVNGVPTSKTVYSYTAYTAEGDEITVTSYTVDLDFDEATKIDESAVYNYNTDNTLASEAAVVEGKITVFGSTIMLDGKYYNYNADMVCYFGDDTAIATNQTVIAVKSTSGTNLTHIWVIADAPEA